jgi:hypothetical protein
MGKDCASARACPTGNKVGGKAVACSGNGACDMGSFTCKCKPGSSGADCGTTRVCADPLCSGNGACDRGACKCTDGFQGVSCESKESASCPKNRGKECSGAGKCFFGKCICPVSLTGNACETQAASKCKADAQGKECSGNGTCDGARCVCTSGYENGLRGICEVAKMRSCPSGGAANKACADQGKCDKRTLQCRCDKGFSGDNCATADATCPGVGGKVCNGVGKCTGGRCTCPRSHSGDACETEATCPSAAGAVCSGANKGICDSRTKTCTCAGLNSGSACDAVRTCSTNSTGSECSARGTCDAKVYKGRGQGQEFSKLTCKCGDGFTGNTCETAERQCPTDTAGQQCGGRDGGNCDKQSGACLCKFGRSGADCSTRPVVVGCPSDCNGLGECKTFTSRAYNATSRAFAFKSIGYCKCSKGTFGRACESSLQGCPSTDAGECNGKGSGKCNEYTGACKCRNGWSGDACNMAAAAVPCPANANGTECSAAGKCNKDGICKCTAHFTGIACATALKSCPLGARKISGRGKSPEEVECSGFGTCDRATGVCTCRSGYSGDACGAKKTCAAPCQNGGKCDSHRGKCLCRNGFKGDVCALACPKDGKNQVCGGRGRCGEDVTCNCRTGFTGAVCGDVSCPANSTGSVCSGQGDCSFSALSGRPRCTCKSGFKGYRCELDAAQHAAKTDDLRAKVDAAIAAAGQQEQELATCTDEDKPFLCPNVPVVSALLRGTCQASRRACSSTSEKVKCKTAGKRWCGVSCISKKLRCPKTRRCKRGKTRCLDGSCAASPARCNTDTTGLCDVAGEVPCGDGVTCAPDAKACRALVQLDGCPIGQVSCASNPKECRASADECSCPVAGESFCGWQRNEKGRMLRIGSVGADGESKLVKVPICGATCGGKANPLTADLKPTPMAADPLEDVDQPLVATDGNGTAASLGAIKIPKGAVMSEDGEVVTFSIKPAALGDVLGGSLKDLEAASTALTLIPDRVVDIDGDIGIEIDLCVGGPEAQADGALCDAVLARLRPYSSQDLTADDATELPGGCQKGSAACGCSCAFTTPHLTTFVVAEGDVAVAGELSADQLDAGVANLVELATTALAPTLCPPGQGNEASALLVSGRCIAPTTTKEACEAAYRALGLGAVTATMVHMPSRHPPGCYLPRGSHTFDHLHFNTYSSSAACTSDYPCLCADACKALTQQPTPFPRVAVGAGVAAAFVLLAALWCSISRRRLSRSKSPPTAHELPGAVTWRENRQGWDIDMANPMHAPGVVPLAVKVSVAKELPATAPEPRITEDGHDAGQGTGNSPLFDNEPGDDTPAPVDDSRPSVTMTDAGTAIKSEAVAPPPHPSPVLMEGRLEKKGERRVQRWKFYRFSLDRASGLLSCFGEGTGRGGAMVAQYRITEVRDLANRKGKRQHRLDFLQAVGAPICCAAPSAAEKAAWLEAASSVTTASAAPRAEHAKLPRLEEPVLAERVQAAPLAPPAGAADERNMVTRCSVHMADV